MYYNIFHHIILLTHIYLILKRTSYVNQEYIPLRIARSTDTSVDGNTERHFSCIELTNDH